MTAGSSTRSYRPELEKAFCHGVLVGITNDGAGNGVDTTNSAHLAFLLAQTAVAITDAS